MRLYSGPLSLFSMKVRIALEEEGLAYEDVRVGWSLERRYEPLHPDVVALNPKGQVPVLVDGDLVVYDSTLIFEYLEDRHPSPPLYPRDAAGRARCRRLEAAADEILFPSVWDLIESSLYPPEAGGRDPARLARARVALERDFSRLDAELADRDYLCDAFSVADIGTFVMANAAAALGAPPPAERVALAAWLALVGSRTSVRREVEASRRFLAGVLATRAASSAA